MSKNLLLVIGALIVVVVGYMMFSNKQTPQEAANPTVAPANEVTVTLSEQNSSGESGTATLMEVAGKVKVTLKMMGAPAGVSQPAHIHTGACPDVGAVKYPLTSPVDGMSETTLDTTLAQLKSELPLGINVHKSNSEAKVYVSCGGLKL